MNSSDNYNHCFKKKENVANEKKKEFTFSYSFGGFGI